MLLELLCLGTLLLPFILRAVLYTLDRMTQRRDARIVQKKRRMAALFHEVIAQHKLKRKLTRAYLQSSSGEPYPYDLFMIEYSGGAHVTDTIWLPVRHFLHASDDTLREILHSELTHPGKYTIKDLQEAVYDFVKREKQNPTQRQVPLWKRLLKAERA